MSLQKSFKLSAVALAIATSSSVMADQINVLSFDDVYGWTPTTSFDTDAFNSVTTASLTVEGSSQLNGAVTVNNVQTTTTVDQAGTPATTPEFGADVDGDGRPDTLLQTKEQTDAITVNTQSQIYNENNLTFSSKVEKGTTTTTDQYTADITYDDNGVASYGPNTALGQTVVEDLTVLSEDSIILGKENAESTTALTVRSKDATGEFETVVTSKDVTTGNVTAETITLGGSDLATTLSEAAEDREAIRGELAQGLEAAAEDREAIRGELAQGLEAAAEDREAIRGELAQGLEAAAEDREAIRGELAQGLEAAAEDREAIRGELAQGLEAAAEDREAIRGELAQGLETAAEDRQAIRDEIAEKVTTNELEVNGPVTVNNVKSTTTVDQAGTPATTPEFGADVDGDGRPDTLLQTKEQTDAITVNTQSQIYNENNLTFSSKVEKGTTTTTDQYTADITYDDNGVASYGPNTALGQTVVEDLTVLSEDSIILGKENAESTTALTVRSKDATGEFETVVTSKDVTTGNVTADSITLGGKDLAQTIADGVTEAKDYTDTTAATLRGEAAAETARVNTAIVDGDAATLAAANDYTDTTAATLRGEAAAETARVNTAIVDGDVATLAAANATTASTAATLRGEAAAETARVNTAIVDGDVATLTAANAYTNTQVSSVNSRVNQLNSRVDDVEKTSYRGIAIALAAQQQIPNIGAGQFAVFGGVGHYEGETAGALGIASVFADGRTSVSAALGVAGGNEVGGRVGVSYVFGGK